MASEYRIHRPYVLATLPRPLDHTEGRIVAREVYGQRDGQKKRKRTELVVGVDGETTSIYDIPASRLITSYPIPPQESFTCPPYSIRIRSAGKSDVARYTYIATRDSSGQKITVFRDVVHPDGKTASTTATQTLKTSPVQYMTCSAGISDVSPVGDLIVVCKNGEVISLSGETLSLHWSSSAKSTVQDVVANNIEKFEVDYIASGTLTEFTEGIFRDRPEVFSTLPKTPASDQELLVLISRSTSKGQESRHCVILAAAAGDAVSSEHSKIAPLDIVPIAASTSDDSPTRYQVDIQAGLLLQLQNGALSVFDLTSAVPKLKSVIQLDDAESFARLSRPFVMSCSLNSIGLFNYQYRSVHATTSLDLSELPTENQSPASCQLISYLRSQDLAVALVENVLVSIQVEPPKNHGRRRKQGLLIDSIGRGTAIEVPSKKHKGDTAPEFSHQVPGTMTEEYLALFRSETETADKLLTEEKFDEWETLLRKKFRMELEKPSDEPIISSQDASDSPQLPEWQWLQGSSSYPAIDRRWVFYALSRVFSIAEPTGEDAEPHLTMILPGSNVASYMIMAGHLTLSNIRSAFRDEFDADALDNKSLATDLLSSLSKTDPSMTSTLYYIQATKLGEVEILIAIRSLMQSMELIPESKKSEITKLLKSEEDESKSIEMDLDELDREIEATEKHLEDEYECRAQALTLAFTKLGRLPSLTTVKALRTVLKTEEILSLLHLLRVELVRGAWTTLYVDPTSFDAEGNEPPPDGVVALLADLLGRCLDAIGAGGWLFNDAIASGDKAEMGDFLTGLKLEVTAALEGLEEAVYLNGIVSEAVRFGVGVQKSGGARASWNTNKPITMELEGRESRLLPLGLKTKQLPTKVKVVSGGEVVQRSVRERGHLISQRVEAYSLEKLAV